MAIDNHGGTWRIRFRLHGVPYQHNTGLPAVERNRKAAQQIEAQMRLHAATGKPIALDVQFSDASKRYLEWCRSEMKASTAKAHATSMASLTAYFDGRGVGQITGGDVEGYKTWRRNNGIAPNTLHNNLCVLSKFFGWCQKHRYREDNPAREVAKPTQRNVSDWYILDAKAEAAYLQAAAGRSPALHDVACIMLDCGLRPEEVLRIRTGDIDGEYLVVPRGKTAAAHRRLWMSPRVRAIVAYRMAAGGGWLFPSPRYAGKPMTKLNNPHDKVCREAKVWCNLYDFRHTFATRCAESGMDIATLAAILGHGSLRVVMRYVHPTPEHQTAAMRRAILGEEAESVDKSGASLDKSSHGLDKKRGDRAGFRVSKSDVPGSKPL